MSDASLGHLLARVGVVEDRIRELVAVRRAGDPRPDDPFRGLYLSDATVDRLLAHAAAPTSAELGPRLAAVEQRADADEAAGATLRLRELSRTFELTALDVALLLVALAGELDPRFEQLFGYLNDDVTRRRPSVAVALALSGAALTSVTARARLLDGPLIRGGLLRLDDPERPFPGRALRVPDRVVAHLLGDDAPDPVLADLVTSVPALGWGDPTDLIAALARGVAFVYLREPATGSGRVLARQALAAVGRPAFAIDLARLATETNEATAIELARTAAREARLRGAGLVAGPVEAISRRAALVDALCAPPCPLLLIGAAAWDPGWATGQPLQVDVASSTPGERSRLWQGALDGHAPDLDVGRATEHFLLRPEQVIRAANAAMLQAHLTPDQRVTASHVQAGARAENGSALQQLARRVQPGVGWDDLVLPPAVRTALEEVALRARHRERVLREWRMRPGGGRGMGVTALFTGDPGTGKTMSAEAVANSLGLDLYVVDLATVVDKYVGETEKNLERIFTAAAGLNGVLLFDEADAIFGKRSEVKDAHDRYANVESAYLLQRMESFDGLAILATNLRANIDEAFTRRLDVVVHFPLPDPECRLALWERCLGSGAPRADDLDLEFCAGAFELSGGVIRSASVTAAYLAADDDEPITMGHVIAAIQREYRKLGRLCLAAEFGRYHALLV